MAGAYFFTYFRTDGKSRGDNVGGYNTLVDGWVQVSDTVFPGMSLDRYRSTTYGLQYSLDVTAYLWEGDWWVRVADEWAGFFPGHLFDPVNGIGAGAARIDWFGEVFDDSAPAPTRTDMGSGAFADTGWEHAAYFRNILYFDAPGTARWFDAERPRATDGGCYSVSGVSRSNFEHWRNWFFYGGPGAESGGCR